jgi:CheY-like chemotaxis protein
LPQALVFTHGLPAVPAAPDILAVDAEGPSATVLIVEDNLANIDTIGDYLAVKGYQVLMAADGREGIALAQRHRPDLILMDVQMPGMDGLEAIRRIRQDPPIAAIPIIALTALALPADRDRCLAAGADDYLSKPVRLKQLTSSIHTLLNQRVNAPSS